MATLFDQLFPPEPRPYSAYAPVRARGPARRGVVAGADDRPQSREAALDEIERVANQMARVSASVPWGRVQNDVWDAHSRFVYRSRTAAGVRSNALAVAARNRLEAMPFVHYALRRWYCFWGARLAELLFTLHPNVAPGPARHREVDFTIDGVPFDLKTTEVPRLFLASIDAVIADPTRVASWLYEHQSHEGRYHVANRLFLLLCDSEDPDEAWRLRGDVAALRAAIDGFLTRPHYVELTVPGAALPALTTVVPVVRQSSTRQLKLAM